jgi:hypothetical protein
MVEVDPTIKIGTTNPDKAMVSAAIEVWSNPAVKQQTPLRLVADECREQNLTPNQCWDFLHMSPGVRDDYRRLPNSDRDQYDRMTPEEKYNHDHQNRNDQYDYRHMTPNERWDHDHGR